MKPYEVRIARYAPVVIALLLLIAPPAFCDSGETDPFVQNRKIRRAVNILGYDPIWSSIDQARFKTRHFQLIKDAGFDAVRINLHSFSHIDAQQKLDDRWLTTLDWAVGGALANQLAVILDCHEYENMGQDPQGNRQKFLAFWRQIAPRFRNAPSDVFFELLNEPSRKLTSEIWNSYLREALAIVRETNPSRTVIIGPAEFNSVNHMEELVLPESDRNIIVTVHYYIPGEFTHQGASWSEYRDKHGIEWLGTDEEKQRITADFEHVQGWAGKHHRPIFLGEFGAYDAAPTDSRLRYISSVARAAEKLGWSWAYWQFDSDFILYDIDGDHWVEPILGALLPR